MDSPGVISMNITRRTALEVGTATLIGATTPLAFSAGTSADSIRIGLSQYSLRQLIRNGSLTAMEYPAFAKDKFGITDVDVWEGGLPAEQQNSEKWLKSLRKRAADGGSNIFLWMTSPVDCTKKSAADRKKVAESFHRPVDNATALGCKFVRIFVRAPDIERADSVQACAETIAPIAEYAKKNKVTLAIEPAASRLTREGSFLAELMKAMDHPHCRLMPDFGKLDGDIYAGNEAMMPWTVVVSAKSHNFDANGNEEKFDYERLIGTVRKSGFRGIVAIEYEGSRLGPVEGVLATQRLLQRHLKPKS